MYTYIGGSLSSLAKSFPVNFAFMKLSLNSGTSLHVIKPPIIENPTETDNGSWAILYIIVSAKRNMSVVMNIYIRE